MKQAPKAFAELRAKQKTEAELAEQRRKEHLAWRKQQLESLYTSLKNMLQPYHDVELDGHTVTMKANNKDHKVTFMVDGKPYIVFTADEGYRGCNCYEQCNCEPEWYEEIRVRTADKEFDRYGFPWSFSGVRLPTCDQDKLAKAFAAAMDEYPKWLEESKKK